MLISGECIIDDTQTSNLFDRKKQTKKIGFFNTINKRKKKKGFYVNNYPTFVFFFLPLFFLVLNVKSCKLSQKHYNKTSYSFLTRPFLKIISRPLNVRRFCGGRSLAFSLPEIKSSFFFFFLTC